MLFDKIAKKNWFLISESDIKTENKSSNNDFNVSRIIEPKEPIKNPLFFNN